MESIRKMVDPQRGCRFRSEFKKKNMDPILEPSDKLPEPKQPQFDRLPSGLPPELLAHDDQFILNDLENPDYLSKYANLPIYSDEEYPKEVYHILGSDGRYRSFAPSPSCDYTISTLSDMFDQNKLRILATLLNQKNHEYNSQNHQYLYPEDYQMVPGFDGNTMIRSELSGNQHDARSGQFVLDTGQDSFWDKPNPNYKSA